MVVEICKYMGWSYQDFLDTPEPMLGAIIIRMNEEARASSKPKYGN